jgi:hypothetical protein
LLLLLVLYIGVVAGRPARNMPGPGFDRVLPALHRSAHLALEIATEAVHTIDPFLDGPSRAEPIGDMVQSARIAELGISRQ